MSVELFYLLKKLSRYPPVMDIIDFYMVDIDRVILSNQIISLKSKSIQLSYNKYTDNNIYLLVNSLPWSDLEYLYLTSNRLTSIYLLAKKLKKTNIKSITLCDNMIEDISPLHFFKNTKLESITFAKNKIKNIDPLVDLLPKSNLKNIILANNKIENITKLLDVIPKSKLEKLFISASNTTLYDKQKISNGIKNINNKLVKIVLYVNYGG